ncbi:D-alanyl-D-alanine carboxypeptidase family protein [Arthrobacter sp. zg-Y750]|uniref:D-alanyl-D-alanine carboxypeptidase family protein n=1 Tax=Arthrobacter sp. zg-Y750 TaxID=2894189 RepID=UPI001E4CFA34|nr:D-alanyl-D-alanine carboxypeptidase family protein [Arthrobacter sp. zg-Y750]MCC9176116.1 D-alanyl-D-alanine carboxypeptidase family protein [Arthrobacter sp. zg-Y750]
MRLTRSSLAVANAVVLLAAFAGVSGATAGQETAIDSAHASFGGSSGGLGAPTGRETCGQRDNGCIRTYQHGAIVWTPATGAMPVWGAIRAAWEAEAAEEGPLGYPVEAPVCGDGSCRQHFQRGLITWSPSTGAAVQRDIDDPASVGAVVNKQRPFGPADYAPADLVPAGGSTLRAEAADAFSRMQADAAAAGVDLALVSAYRSYSAQSAVYDSYVARYGVEAADRISARPGHSEHQSGLAADVGAADGSCQLQACFAQTPAGQWVEANAHRFGFIVRYPEGAEPVTGYAYEPWHLRYVGDSMAAGLRASGAGTLETYLGLAPAPGY